MFDHILPRRDKVLRSSSHFLGFYDELDKIAKKTGPGSRGGEVVGYYSSGRPIYASERDELVPAKKPPMVARVMQGLMGTGMMASQASLVGRYAKGRNTLYHGTSIPAGASIMGSERGIDPAFAGAGRRAGAGDYAEAAKGLKNVKNIPDDMKDAMDFAAEHMREDYHAPGATAAKTKRVLINRYMMAESFGRILEKNKVPITHEQLAGIPEKFHKLMDSGMQSGPASEKVYKEITDELIKDGKMSKELADKIRKGLGKELSQHGQRVYLGFSPADVAHYGSGEAELQKTTRRLVEEIEDPSLAKHVKRTVRGTVETMTGGLPTTIKDSFKRLTYKPHHVETMTGAQVEAELRRLKHSANPENLRVVFGASIPTKEMGYLEDFPVIRRLFMANPGLKHTLSMFGFDSYEAGKDISFPHHIPRNNIKSVDLIDQVTGKIRRIMITDAKQAARTPILRRVGRMAWPVGLAALGGSQVYRAFKPKERMVSKLHPLASEETPTKTAGVARDMGQIAKYVVPAAVVGGGLGYGAHRGIEHLIPKRYPVTPKEQIMEVPRVTARLLASSLGAVGGGALLGAGAGLVKTRKQLGMKGSALLGAIAGATGGYTFGVPGAVGREEAMYPETDPSFGAMHHKVQDLVRKYPVLGSIKEVGTMAALPLGSAYVVRKYYPSAFAKGVMAAKRAVRDLS